MTTNNAFVSEINVTPMVDVMLVLLVIFMVTAPMMVEGLEVKVPEVEHSETLPTENDHLILSVKADGTVFLDETEVAHDRLVPVLTGTVKNPGKQLFVRADAGVSYGRVMQVMGLIRGAGIKDVGLVTVPPAGQGAIPGTSGASGTSGSSGDAAPSASSGPAARNGGGARPAPGGA